MNGSKEHGSLADRISARYPHKKNGKTYLGTGVAAVLIALIVLVAACFSALTYLSASSKMETSEKNRVYCDHYYAAETVASELLGQIAAGKDKPASEEGDKAVYNTDSGKVTVAHKGSYVSFNVAINKKQDLHVEAKIKDKKTRITTWAVE